MIRVTKINERNDLKSHFITIQIQLQFQLHHDLIQDRFTQLTKQLVVLISRARQNNSYRMPLICVTQ